MSAASGCYLNFYYGSVFIVLKLWYSKSSQSKGMISRIRSNFSFSVVIFLRKRFELTEVNEGVKGRQRCLTDYVTVYFDVKQGHPNSPIKINNNGCLTRGIHLRFSPHQVLIFGENFLFIIQTDF